MTDLPTPPAPATLPQLPPRTPFWGRIETLWLLMVPLCALLFALALPLAPNDLWYHVRAGELIAARGAVPGQNLMSRGVPLDAPYYYQSWLAELGLFALLRGGGLTALMLGRAFALTATLLLIVAATWRAVRRSGASSARAAAHWTAASALLGFALASNNVDLRPQTFSMVLFGAWVFAVGEWRALPQRDSRQRSAWGAAIVLLMALWANTHGAFVVGLLGLAALALGDVVARSERQRASLLVWGASLGAVALNPRGLGIYLYVAQLSGNEIGQRFVQEWKSPGLDDWHSALFWLAPLVLLGAWLGGRRRGPLDAGQTLALALFWTMGARDQRAILWFALALIPFLAPLVTGASGARQAPGLAPPRGAQGINACLLLFLLLCPLALFPGVKARWPWPAAFGARFAPTPRALFPGEPPLLLENSTPTVAVDWLQKHPPRGALFTDMVCGSYLAYAGRGQLVPWCDPRIELFPTAFWEEYLRLSAGPPNAAARLRQQGFSDALLDRQNMPKLVQRLRDSRQWRVVAQSGSTLLLRYNG